VDDDGDGDGGDDDGDNDDSLDTALRDVLDLLESGLDLLAALPAGLIPKPHTQEDAQENRHNASPLDAFPFAPHMDTSPDHGASLQLRPCERCSDRTSIVPAADRSAPSGAILPDPPDKSERVQPWRQKESHSSIHSADTVKTPTDHVRPALWGVGRVSENLTSGFQDETAHSTT